MQNWRDSLLGYFHPRLFAVLFLGFASGLPYGMLIDPLSFWLSESGVSRSAIGLMSLIILTYSLKAIWAPFIDRLKLPVLFELFGARKSWLVLSQIAVAAALIGLAGCDPKQSVVVLLTLSLAVAFSSATQDICVDAMRIELLNEEQLGQGAAVYQGGWRLAFLLTQVVTFLIASRFDWSAAYTIAAVTMLVIAGFTILLVPEPSEIKREHISLLANPKIWLETSYVDPFLDIAKRYQNRIYLILLLVMSYRFSDLILGPMAMPFYQETGFSKEEIAIVTNAFGISVSLAGAFIGGLLVYRYSAMTALLLGSVMVALTNLTFALLAIVGNNISALTLVIICDNLAQGLATAALVAYLSSLTTEKFTATQYALLFLLATLPARFLGSSSGFVVDAIGYFNFFIYAALMGLPAIALCMCLWREKKIS